MQYKLIIGYNIISGPNVSNEESEIRFENESSKFILTRDPDSYLKPAEIDLAIGITAYSHRMLPLFRMKVATQPQQNCHP